DPEERVTSITRLGTVDGLPASYGTTQIPEEVAPDLAAHAGDGVSIYEVLRREYGLEPRRLRVRAELVAAPGEVATHLGLEGRPLVWWLESCNHDARLGRPV